MPYTFEKNTLIHNVREFLSQFERKVQCNPIDLEEFLQFDNNGETEAFLNN